MSSLLPLIIVGLFIYLIFFRRGGMGCCGTHAGHNPGHGRSTGSEWTRDYHSEEGEVIDLREDQYTVLTSPDDAAHPSREDERKERSTWAN